MEAVDSTVLFTTTTVRGRGVADKEGEVLNDGLAVSVCLMEAVEDGVGELEEDTVRVTVRVREAVAVNPVLAVIVGETERVEAVERDAEDDAGAEGV